MKKTVWLLEMSDPKDKPAQETQDKDKKQDETRTVNPMTMIPDGLKISTKKPLTKKEKVAKKLFGF